jgi:UDP-glucuronate 4-epimerase
VHILVTGAAGFIGFHVAEALLRQGHLVTGIDNLNAYYTVALKEARLDILRKYDNFTFHLIDIANKNDVDGLLKLAPAITHVIHLAAQAGVRYSIQSPQTYIESNLTGHFNILEMVRHLNSLENFVYASSSSVYGANASIPFAESQAIASPLSLYAATKIADEAMSYAYAHLFQKPMTGLRFFTVYGPWGRPDMAPIIFTRAIMQGEPITLFNDGKMRRDFTYIDDIVSGVLAAMKRKVPGHHVYNLGNHQPVELEEFVSTIEAAVGKDAVRRYAPMQEGDMVETYADIQEAVRDLGFMPRTPLNEGIVKLVSWYREHQELLR